MFRCYDSQAVFREAGLVLFPEGESVDDDESGNAEHDSDTDAEECQSGHSAVEFVYALEDERVGCEESEDDGEVEACV